MLVDEVGFIPIDWVVIARRNQSSNTGLWAHRARQHNFYLRGHKHLLLMRKPQDAGGALRGRPRHPDRTRQRHPPPGSQRLTQPLRTNGYEPLSSRLAALYVVPTDVPTRMSF